MCKIKLLSFSSLLIFISRNSNFPCNYWIWKDFPAIPFSLFSTEYRTGSRFEWIAGLKWRKESMVEQFFEDIESKLYKICQKLSTKHSKRKSRQMLGHLNTTHFKLTKFLWSKLHTQKSYVENNTK